MELYKLGSITVHIGCMYSGKTSFLISEYAKRINLGESVLCINYAGDNRYGDDDYLYSHDRNKILCTKCYNLADIDNDLILAHDVILINESQFFSDLVEYCLKWCEEYGKKIIVSGLDGSSDRKKIGHTLDLLPYADDYFKRKALCKKCYKETGREVDAVFTFRNSMDKSEILIGGCDEYEAVCRSCYLELTKNKVTQTYEDL